MEAFSGDRKRLAVDWSRPDQWRLDSGLTVLHLPVRHAALVTTVLSYRVGAADDSDDVAGAAHFLEHMMFKGSSRFGPGDIDRKTQELGGWNNAYTGHDATAYLFGLASDRWEAALEIEADRMRGLTLSPREVDSERRVIREEISMYLDDPWDALELEVSRRLFNGHPYGRPILGTRESLAAIDADVLDRLHAARYCPGNAVLAVAGDVSRAAVEDHVGEHFADIPARASASSRPARRAGMLGTKCRVERRKGEVARFLLALPAPVARDDDYARLLLATAVLGSGRASRLHRRLVEESRICSRVTAEVSESVDPGTSLITAETMPGADPQRVEREIGEVLNALASDPPDEVELERARSMMIADWVFAHERIHQRAMVVANAVTLFDAGHPGRVLETACATSGSELSAAVGRWLDPTGLSVAGWSLPEARE